MGFTLCISRVVATHSSVKCSVSKSELNNAWARAKTKNILPLGITWYRGSQCESYGPTDNQREKILVQGNVQSLPLFKLVILGGLGSGKKSTYQSLMGRTLDKKELIRSTLPPVVLSKNTAKDWIKVGAENKNDTLCTLLPVCISGDSVFQVLPIGLFSFGASIALVCFNLVKFSNNQEYVFNEIKSQVVKLADQIPEISVALIGTHASEVETSILQAFSKKVRRCTEFREIQVLLNRDARLYLFPVENQDENGSASKTKQLFNIRNEVFQALDLASKSAELKAIHYNVLDLILSLKAKALEVKKLSSMLRTPGLSPGKVFECIEELVKRGLLLAIEAPTGKKDEKVIVLDLDWFYSLFSTILYDPKKESREFTIASLKDAHDVIEYEESGKLRKSLYKSFCAVLKPEEYDLLTRAAVQFEVMKELDDDYYIVPAMAEMAEELPVAKIVGL